MVARNSANNMTGTRTKLWCACMIVLGGTVSISAGKQGSQPGPPETAADERTPAFLHLDSAADREAFRQWFAAIAEYQALRPTADLPAEINDCAALLRYAYRGALQAHSAAWLAENKLEALAFLPSVKKYSYPHTPLGAALFRIRPPEDSADLRSSYAEFADAHTLQQFNAFFVSRDIRL